MTNRNGFTLTEVLIVVAIAATVAIVVVFSIQPAMQTESTEKLYEQTSSLLSAIHTNGRVPGSDVELRRDYPSLSQGFTIKRQGDKNQFVYLEHQTPDGFSQNRISGLTSINDGTFMVYLGTVGLTAGVPSGTVVPFAGDVVPDGWLPCDGRTMDRASYPELSLALKSIYGGNASQFNLPNLNGKFALGGTSAGQTGGSNSVSLSVANLPSHNHSGGPAITALTPGSSPWGGYICGLGGTWLKAVSISGSSADVGGNSPVNVMPPYLELQYIIKT